MPKEDRILLKAKKKAGYCFAYMVDRCIRGIFRRIAVCGIRA
jgi:hypothetical protein